MRRSESFASPAWDDPFWHAVRMLVDVFKNKAPTEHEILSGLESRRESGTSGISAYLRRRSHLVKPLADYLQLRIDLATELLGLMRSEEEAKADLARISDVEVLTYGTRMAGHHQSSKVLVATVEVITNSTCVEFGKVANVNPQQRATVIADDHLWVSPRRLDGVFPALTNPTALWEIKEYWGKTNGGSKMSDAIYECQLVGTELRAFEDRHGVGIGHYVILDGRSQWESRKSDLRRAVDLLYCGLVDELVVGREVISEWPRIMRRLCTEDLVRN